MCALSHRSNRAVGATRTKVGDYSLDKYRDLDRLGNLAWYWQLTARIAVDNFISWETRTHAGRTRAFTNGASCKL